MATIGFINAYLPQLSIVRSLIGIKKAIAFVGVACLEIFELYNPMILVIFRAWYSGHFEVRTSGWIVPFEGKGIALTQITGA